MLAPLALLKLELYLNHLNVNYYYPVWDFLCPAKLSF